MDTPAGDTSGPSPTPTHEDEAGQATFELPAKLRVHALAKLLEVSSREVITALESNGHSVRSAQSNITREIAQEVVRTLRPERVAESDEEPGEPQDPQEVAAHADPDNGSAGGLNPVFAAPQAMFLAPEPAKRAQVGDHENEQPKKAKPQREPAFQEDSNGHAAESEDDESTSEDASSRRRRRRGRRGRGRGRGGEGDTGENGAGENGETTADETGEHSADKPGKPAEEKSEKKDKPTETEEQSDRESDSEHVDDPNRRRRRRRRRKGTGENDNSTRDDDPPNTVVHVRESQPESSDDEVRSVKGSTRLEAKRQRRRDGREAGRRRAPVLSESEFLARRESVDRTMVVREHGDQTQIAVLEDNVLVENFVTSAGSGSLVGNVYLGRVQNVLPSMEAAFVDIGRGRNAVLYAGEVDWDAAGLAGKARRIEQALTTGDSVLVQVTKDPVGHKGARLTTQISLPGRFLVYVPGGSATGISRKLPDNERKRLKEILKRVVPDNAGVIIRTASEGTSEEALDRDVRRLQAQWEIIKEKADTPKAQAPQLLYEEPDLLIRVVRDLFTEDFSALMVQGSEAWETIESYVSHVAPDLLSRLHKHVGKNDVFTEQRITEQISKALDRKVWLPSGGYLVIDRTEAMTVIDVNTGKYTGSGGNLEETVTRNNLEAAEEIVRQLRLRDIGGIIVIDFIDMVLEANRDLVLRRLTECLGRDRTRHQVAEVTSLGLVQMTRKRVGTGLLEAYSSTCEHCRGRGLMVSTDPVTHSHGAGSSSSGGNGGGNGGGGSRRQRRAKERSERSGDDSTTTVSTAAPSPEPAPVAKAESSPEPAPVAKAESKPAETAKSEPVSEDAEPTMTTSDSGAAPSEAAAPVRETEPKEEQQAEPAQQEPTPISTTAVTATDESEPVAAAEPPQSPVAGRTGRRKARRPAGGASTPVTPMVVEQQERATVPSAPSNNGVSVATPVTRRRRAAGRPAGPAAEETPNEASADA